jgi:hypothetical protein
MGKTQGRKIDTKESREATTLGKGKKPTKGLGRNRFYYYKWSS